MSVSSVLTFLAGAATLVHALPSSSRWTIESVVDLPEGWAFSGPANDDAQIKLSFSLRNSEQMDVLKRHILETTDIKSPSYSSHLSGADVQALRQPPKEHIQTVHRWLTESGISEGSIEARNDWVHATATVKQARSLLGADISVYSFNEEASHLRTREYSLPEHVALRVDFVHPVTNFMTPPNASQRHHDFMSKLKARVDKRAMILGTDKNVHNMKIESQFSSYPCLSEVTPDCLRELYNITLPEETEPLAHLGIGGFLEQYPTNQDLADFLKEHEPDLPSSLYNITFQLINGGIDDQDENDAGGEASLDVQYGIPLSYPASVSYLSTGGRGIEIDDNGKNKSVADSENEPYLEFFEALLAMDDSELPSVLSISYADDEKSVPTAYAYKVCDLIASVTARGVSILFASGDGGSRGVRSGNCLTNDGMNIKTTTTSFPGSCPWATSVGALENTDVLQGADFSTGGFSRLFSRPSWQDSAAISYISELDGLLDGYYNASGRAMPDVAAVGSEFLINQGGYEGTVYGTSASTPVFASVITRINQARAKVGKKPVGFLNQALYSAEISSALTDVTHGTSDGCSWSSKSVSGWPAKPGYDAITGLGIPGDYYKLEQAFLALA